MDTQKIIYKIKSEKQKLRFSSLQHIKLVQNAEKKKIRIGENDSRREGDGSMRKVFRVGVTKGEYDME